MENRPCGSLIVSRLIVTDPAGEVFRADGQDFADGQLLSFDAKNDPAVAGIIRVKSIVGHVCGDIGIGDRRIGPRGGCPRKVAGRGGAGHAGRGRWQAGEYT